MIRLYVKELIKDVKELIFIWGFIDRLNFLSVRAATVWHGSIGLVFHALEQTLLHFGDQSDARTEGRSRIGD